MSLDVALCLPLVIGLVAYLLYALLHAERF